MGYQVADVKNVAECMRNQNGSGYSTCILIGAGVSVSAGIPDAQGLCMELKKNYPHIIQDAKSSSYFEYMSLLPRGIRKQFIRNYIKKTKMNASYISLAALVKEGYISRILTTNFDLLIEKALSFYKYRLTTYDFACNQIFIAGDVPPKALFYLHGKGDGFLLLNTPAEINSLKDKLTSLFEDSNTRRLWIIIGYSGNDQPVFEGIKNIENYDFGLYWVSKNQTPSENVENHILSKEHTYFIPNKTADEFFKELTTELHINLREYSRPKMMVNLNEIDAELTDAGVAEASDIFNVNKNDITCLAYKIYNNDTNTSYLHRIFIKKSDFNLIEDEHNKNNEINIIKTLIKKKKLSLHLKKSHQLVPAIVAKDSIVLDEEYNTPAMLHVQISYKETNSSNKIEPIELLISKYMTPLNLCGYILDRTPKSGYVFSLTAEDLYENQSYQDEVIESVSKFYWPFSHINSMMIKK